MTDLRRQRPSDPQLDAIVAGARTVVMAEATTRRAWWRRLSRSTVVVGVVGVVAAGGIAYAAVERATDEPPETHKGNSVIHFGKAAPGDKWLNVSVSFKCEPGESFILRDAKSEIFAYDCKDESTSGQSEGAGLRGRGVMDSVPIDKVHGTRLVMTSTLSRNYLVTATWGPRPVIETQGALPEDGPDGKPDWDIPTYEVNEYGLTVGTPNIRTPESAWPDLYPVRFKGKEAYFRKADMVVGMAGTPEEASRQTEERRRLGLDVDGKSYRFVYAADGKTKLGKIYVGSYSEE